MGVLAALVALTLLITALWWGVSAILSLCLLLGWLCDRNPISSPKSSSFGDIKNQRLQITSVVPPALGALLGSVLAGIGASIAASIITGSKVPSSASTATIPLFAGALFSVVVGFIPLTFRRSDSHYLTDPFVMRAAVDSLAHGTGTSLTLDEIERKKTEWEAVRGGLNFGGFRRRETPALNEMLYGASEGTKRLSLLQNTARRVRIGLRAAASLPVSEGIFTGGVVAGPLAVLCLWIAINYFGLEMDISIGGWIWIIGLVAISIPVILGSMISRVDLALKRFEIESGALRGLEKAIAKRRIQIREENERQEQLDRAVEIILSSGPRSSSKVPRVFSKGSRIFSMASRFFVRK